MSPPGVRGVPTSVRGYNQSPATTTPTPGGPMSARPSAALAAAPQPSTQPATSPFRLLGDPSPTGRRGPRTAAAVFTAACRDGTLASVPHPGHGATARRWAALAGWGRIDLSTARLVEGQLDALSILAEAGREPVPGARYGVWAARSGGTGAELSDRHLHGTVRFCSGAHMLDRALVVAGTGAQSLVFDVDVRDPRVTPVEGTWRTPGMAEADSVDVVLRAVPAERRAAVGPPGFYTERPGFWWGGAGVAAVWLGGAAGVVDALHATLGPEPDLHQLAHLGTLHTALAGTDALLAATADAVDAEPHRSHRAAAWTVRAAAEQTARTVLDVVPRSAGVAALVRGGSLAGRLADLAVYVRQHHGERDLAALGAQVHEVHSGDVRPG